MSVVPIFEQVVTVLTSRMEFRAERKGRIELGPYVATRAELPESSKENQDTHKSFGLASTQNHFKASETIKLTSLGFYGSHIEKATRKEFFLQVYIGIWEGIYPGDKNMKIGEKNSHVFCIEGDRISVELDKPIYIKAHQWYTVQFVLSGPPTFRLKERQSEVDVSVDGGRAIHFEFLGPSMQLTRMEFLLVPTQEMKKAEEQWKENKVKAKANGLHKYSFFSTWFEKVSSYVL